MKLKHQNLIGRKTKTFNFIKILGEGAWAVVYQAIDENTNSTVAIKAIPKIVIKQQRKLEELIATEIRVLKECHNENVVRFVDNFSTEQTQCIAMEYCNGGDLEHYLDKKKRLTEDEATVFLKQIINGFRGLHEVNAMHRDFKVANVLLHDGICKIADLGFAKQLDKKKKMTGTILGTSLTMAPELLREQNYGIQADIWSLGVVYYQLLYGKYPYYANTDPAILNLIETRRPDFSGVNLSKNARDFIDRCLNDDPLKRISWKEIYNHPLIVEDQKMKYGFVSKINFKESEKFYQQQVKIEDIFSENPFNHKKESLKEDIVKSDQANMQKYLKQAEIEKQISSAIQKYQKLYLNRRNNIMFIFKFVTPYIWDIYSTVKANHGITLFILSKKAYHEMKEFHNYIMKTVNFMKLGPYFQQFVKSPKYKSILETTNSDKEIILAQISCYQDDIIYCSSSIKQEFDVQRIANKNWNNFVNQTISQYEFQLGEGLDVVKGAQKMTLLKIIEALTYYKQQSENADIENFDRKIESMDFELEESKIRSRLDSILKGK